MKNKKVLSVQQIDKLLKRRNSLTDVQKQLIVHSIYNNPKANKIAVAGALEEKNFGLAAHLVSFQRGKTVDKNCT